VKSRAPMKSNGSDGSLSPCQLSSGDLLQLNLAYESSLRHNPQKSQHSAKSLAPLKSNCSDGSLSPCELSSGDLLQLNLAYESSLRHNPQKSQHSAKSLAPLKSNCSDGSLSPCELSSGDLLQLNLAYESSLRHNSIMQKGGSFFFFLHQYSEGLEKTLMAGMLHCQNQKAQTSQHHHVNSLLGIDSR
jgi:hypothetical protein